MRQAALLLPRATASMLATHFCSARATRHDPENR